jgi:hypothetical protein
MTAVRAFKIVGALLGAALLGFVGYLIAFNTMDPSFSVEATRDPNGAYRFNLSPNFIVNSVYHVKIIGPAGIAAERKEPVAGDQILTVSSGLAPNDPVTIECELQYDRGLAPCITTKTKSLVLK